MLKKAVSTRAGDRPLCTVESMLKLSRDEQDSLVFSMGMEWKAAMEPEAPTGAMESPMKEEYWMRPRSNIRHITIEAPSPKSHP